MANLRVSQGMNTLKYTPVSLQHITTPDHLSFRERPYGAEEHVLRKHNVISQEVPLLIKIINPTFACTPFGT